MNTKINRIHERALRIVYDDNVSTFEDLLVNSGSIQNIAIEVYKALHNLSSVLMSDLFSFKNTMYNIRGGGKLKMSNIKTTNYGSETISYLGPKVWDLVPNEIKSISSLDVFERKIKAWTPTTCPCRLCKAYVENLGYI